MTVVNEALIQSDRFRKELESLVRNGDPNVLTASKVRHGMEERFSLEKDALRVKPWKTMVTRLLDEVLVKIQEEDMDADTKKLEQDKPDEKAVIKSEKKVKSQEKRKSEDQTEVKTESKDDVKEESDIAKSASDDEMIVEKPAPKKRVSKKKASSPKATKAKAKKESSPTGEGSSDEEVTTTKKGQKSDSKGTSPNEEKIKKLKMYISKCGIRKKWNTEFAGLTSQSQQIKKLQSILQDLGVEGRPTLEKCEKVKAERELKAEIASLDTDNILDDDESVGRRNTRRSQPAKRKRRIVSSDEDDDSPSKVAKKPSTGLDISFLGDQGSDSE